MTKRLFFVFWCSFCHAKARLSDWTVLLVMQGDNNLSFFMHQNIAALKKIGSTKNTNILIQWDEPFKHVTSRYKIGLNKLLDDASLPQDMGVNPGKELTAAAHWAFTTYPAKQYALILWNHGSGILDEKQDWNKSRGILYDFSSKKCLTNRALLQSLKTIQRDVLGGKSIDLIGMDACLMAMLEVAYQIKDFAKIFVASENIEYAPGWNYNSIFQKLTQSPQSYTATTLAHLVVHSFASFNTNRHAMYTQSAIDLAHISILKENVSAFASACLTAKEQKILQKCITEARATCTSFDHDHFIDLYDFYQRMEKSVANKKNLSSATLTTILNIISEGKILLKQCVINSRSGRALPHAQGLSIYFPRTQKIDRTYHATLFAQETTWPLFLQTFATTKKIPLLSNISQKESCNEAL